jgi:tetratricopeptide (TPR) repeat protein|tara:strand:- start:2064 stop:2501 length:438 start_codon:yes stop_codon:yes gene_type:complete
MFKKIKFLAIIFVLFNYTQLVMAKNNFYADAKKKYEAKEYDQSKFLFQRNIVFNPKDYNSYLYLAKIYNVEENQREEEKNIDTVLLLDPKNEEANYMLINIELKKSNYLKVKELTIFFSKICSELCGKKDLIKESLKNLEPKNDS